MATVLDNAWEVGKMKRIVGELLFTYLILSISFAVAEDIQAGDEWMNVGEPKDIFSFPTFASDVISSLAVGEPCVIRSVEGDWLEIAFYKEMLGHQTGWITAEGMERVESMDLLYSDLPVDPPITPSYHADFGSAYGTGMRLRTTQHMDFGYSVDASVTETREGILDINVFVTFDSDYTTNDDIANFNLYLNGEQAACVYPYWDKDNRILAPTTFYASIGYSERIYEAYLVPVHEEWGEYSHQRIYLQENVSSQSPPATPETGVIRLYADAQVVPGCTVHASLTQTTGDMLSVNVFLTFDSNYTTNDDIVSFNLYLNGQ